MPDLFHTMLAGFTEQVRAQVRQESQSAGQMTLGNFIDALAVMPQQALVYYRDTNVSPGAPLSYRGFYEQLAFRDRSQRSVAEVLTDAKNAMGAMFEGYKGGEYWMTGNTMIWRAEYGCSGDRIVGVEQVGDSVIVNTVPYED